MYSGESLALQGLDDQVLKEVRSVMVGLDGPSPDGLGMTPSSCVHAWVAVAGIRDATEMPPVAVQAGDGSRR